MIIVVLSGQVFVGPLKGFGGGWVGGVQELLSPKGLKNPYGILDHPLQQDSIISFTYVHQNKNLLNHSLKTVHEVRNVLCCPYVIYSYTIRPLL